MTEKLIVYKDLAADETVRSVEKIYNEKDNAQSQEGCSMMSEAVSSLICFAEEKGLCGNLWKAYLTNLLVNSENAYSQAAEIGGKVDGSILQVVAHDMDIIRKLYDMDIAAILAACGMSDFSYIENYSVIGNSHVYNTRIRDRIRELTGELSETESTEQFTRVLTEFYNQYGVGKFGLHKAFRIQENRQGEVDIIPILKIAHVSLSDLVGYEIPKQKLVENTEAFVSRRPANNCLLFGDAGTGKSSSIKAIANEYYDKGLRIIEVYRHQFSLLNDVIAQIKDRNYRFIIYMDDLSFEEFETEYKYLKAVIEGGLEKKPENILIYATSNRRHLIRETSSDRDDRDPDMHRSDTMAEKLSLSGRFGVSIYFGSPDKKQFDEIVLELARRHGIDMPEQQLLLEANKWELSHGGRSGRTAQQFIDHVLGTEQAGV